MNSLAVNLSKEWREQRGALGVLAIVALGAVGVAAATLSRATLQDPLVAQWIVGLTVLGTVMSIGADLLARERQRGLEFLARIPHGLERAARGKLCFFALALFGAFAYGALLAAGASFARTSALPIGALDNASLWLPIALAVSLWVFAVSAWMPNSALTLPATALFLGVFAFPAVLAVVEDAVFRPTPLECLVFIALCTAGAPVSAWASFVIGSRRGGSRTRAALIGIAAAVPFFAPAWIWAGARYVALRNAPFEIVNGWVGPDEHYAFLNLSRVAPRGTPKERMSQYETATALIVDLDRGESRFAGKLDLSGFVESRWSFRRHTFLESTACNRVTLYETDVLNRKELDCVTASELADDNYSEPSNGPTPVDFGLSIAPKAYTIRWAGLGQLLDYHDGDKQRFEIYRDPERGLNVERTKLLPDERNREYFDIRIRPGRWLVRKQVTWMWIDPTSGATEPLACVAPKETIGPSVDDGRFVLIANGAVFLLDPETGERQGIDTSGAADLGGVGFLSTETTPYPAPLELDTPCVVVVSGRQCHGVGMLDLRARTLRIISTGVHPPIQLMSSHGAQALTLENNARIVRYDIERGTHEVLFDVADVH
jgi:hypothetical protein